MNNEDKQILELEVSQKALNNAKLWEYVKRLDSGSGTYKDVKAIAEIVGDSIVDRIVESGDREVLEFLTELSHALIIESGISAQTNLNNAARIGIAPKTTKYPTSKVKALGDKLEQSDDLIGVARTAIPSLTIEMVDDMLRYNLDFQADAGLKPVIVRTWSGSRPSHDTKHTDWCESIAGEYDYGSEPRNVYARHEGCRCTVDYYPSRGAKSRITALAKGEIDKDSVLWNTKAETLEQRMRQKLKHK